MMTLRCLISSRLFTLGKFCNKKLTVLWFVRHVRVVDAVARYLNYFTVLRIMSKSCYSLQWNQTENILSEKKYWKGLNIKNSTSLSCFSYLWNLYIIYHLGIHAYSYAWTRASSVSFFCTCLTKYYVHTMEFFWRQFSNAFHLFILST